MRKYCAGIMKINTWTYALFIIKAVGGTPLAQYTPDGSLCLVPDVSDDGVTCNFAADVLQLRFGPYSLPGQCQLFSECIDDGNLSLKDPACSDGKYAALEVLDSAVKGAALRLMDVRQF